MKKILISVAMIAVVLMVLFAACEFDTITTMPKAAGPAKPTVAQIGSNYYVIVSWDAASNATGYNVFVQQDGKKTVTQCGRGQNNYTYAAQGTGYNTLIHTENTDVDKWSAAIEVQFTYGSGGYSYQQGDLPAGKYRFGVQAYDAIPNHVYSDISWSEYFSVAAPANITY